VQAEGKKIETCEGTTSRAVRNWIRQINNAVRIIPQNINDNLAVQGLINATARGDVEEEYQVMIAGQMALGIIRGAIGHQAILNHIQLAFLGSDEAEALKEELKTTKQSAREEVPAYNRRFTKIADLAYPQAVRAPAVDAEVAGRYIASLKSGAIQRALFNHRPRIITLGEAKTFAYTEWTETRYQQRLTHLTPQAEEAMEIGALDTMREQMAAQASLIKRLQTQLDAVQQTTVGNSRAPAPPPAAADSGQDVLRRDTRPRRKADGSPGRCYYCDKPGHIQSECRRRQWDNSHNNDKSPAHAAAADPQRQGN
jgi:hypothetical protein